jgi:hypothetical protein
MRGMESFDHFCSAVLDLIALRRFRLDGLPLPDPDLQAANRHLRFTTFGVEI